LPVGQGRVVLRDGGDGTSLNFELLDDGSSVLSSSLRFFRGDIIHIGASLLVRRVFYLVGLALQHVAGAGTGGRLEMSLRYSPPPGGFLITGDHHGQQHKWREGEESEDVAAGVNASDVPLLITRELLTGVFHAYGLPEVGYITAEGRLSRRHWHPHGGNDWPTEVWAARV